MFRAFALPSAALCAACLAISAISSSMPFDSDATVLMTGGSHPFLSPIMTTFGRSAAVPSAQPVPFVDDEDADLSARLYGHQAVAEAGSDDDDHGADDECHVFWSSPAPTVSINTTSYPIVSMILQGRGLNWPDRGDGRRSPIDRI